VVVTDLAWPHIAGVRYWVAAGATIVSHRSSREFLTKVVERRWTLAPDLLERSRANARFKFIAVDRSFSAEHGGIRIVAIDGIGSEGALVAYLPADGFLWASDYIQTAGEPTLYAGEVIRAAARYRLTPQRVAAEHLPLTPWKTVVDAQHPPTKVSNERGSEAGRTVRGMKDAPESASGYAIESVSSLGFFGFRRRLWLERLRELIAAFEVRS